MSELGVDLDALRVAIDRERGAAHRGPQEVTHEIRAVSRAREQAIEARRFELAAELRDRERNLLEELHTLNVAPDDILGIIRRHLGIPRRARPPGNAS